ITDWERPTHPFSAKYLINICSDKAFSKNPEFSSIVFQVHKDFMQMTDRIVEMEAHILELGDWGHRLDEQINAERNSWVEKEAQYKSRLQEIEDINRKQVEDIGRLASENNDKT